MKIEIRKPSAEERRSMAENPIWSCGVSEFDWHYEEREICLILEGAVTVVTKEGEARFGPGDLVTFPEGLDCKWKVEAPVRKHYRFG